MEEKFNDKLEGFSRRVVCDQNTLREKALIFDNGPDDRVIEIIKMISFANLCDQFPDAEITAIVCLIWRRVFLLFSRLKSTV